MKKHLVVLLTLLIPSLALPKEPPKLSKNPVLAEILKLNPRVNRSFAVVLSNYIAKYSHQFKTDPRLSVAIAMQETAFMNKNRKGVIYVHGRMIHGITDVGVFQIHIATIENLGIDVERLKRDVEYQTYWHIKILAEKIKVCTAQRDKLKVDAGDEWACYHSFNKPQRDVYLTDVGAHLVRLGQL